MPIDLEDQLSHESGVIKWEMATQTIPVEIIDPTKQKAVSVHDLVTDLHEKQKSFDIHAHTMKQVELREETLKQEHESRVAILEDRIENLSQRLKERDEEIEAQKTQSGKLEETKRKLTR